MAASADWQDLGATSASFPFSSQLLHALGKERLHKPSSIHGRRQPFCVLTLELAGLRLLFTRNWSPLSSFLWPSHVGQMQECGAGCP